MNPDEKFQLLEELQWAGEDYREAEERLREAEADARVAGLSEEQIREAKGLWLR